ncbi:hypothetical protein DFH06DRAFT_1316287 [Mycena polygramma]|nr:hypothetical protein DFH06DRAFT_1316287 [Mycena polygramma]
MALFCAQLRRATHVVRKPERLSDTLPESRPTSISPKTNDSHRIAALSVIGLWGVSGAVYREVLFRTHIIHGVNHDCLNDGEIVKRFALSYHALVALQTFLVIALCAATDVLKDVLKQMRVLTIIRSALALFVDHPPSTWMVLAFALTAPTVTKNNNKLGEADDDEHTPTHAGVRVLTVVEMFARLSSPFTNAALTRKTAQSYAAEEGQIAAIRELASVYLRRWPAMMLGLVAPGESRPLREAAGVLQQLGDSPPPVQDTVAARISPFSRPELHDPCQRRLGPPMRLRDLAALFTPTAPAELPLRALEHA